METTLYRNHLAILEEELQVAMGCTEPIAIAFAAAKARRAEDLAPILKAMLAKELPDLTAAGRRVAQARSLARVGQALFGIYEKEAAPCARPEPVGTAQIF